MILTLLTMQAVPASAPLQLFFDSGKSEIRSEWTSVLDSAAALAREGRRLSVTGHSDTPGSARVNQRVAMERARSVASALAARGVEMSAIDVSAEGEAQLLVPTAEGVREIQNRRVVITPLP